MSLFILTHQYRKSWLQSSISVVTVRNFNYFFLQWIGNVRCKHFHRALHVGLAFPSTRRRQANCTRSWSHLQYTLYASLLGLETPTPCVFLSVFCWSELSVLRQHLQMLCQLSRLISDMCLTVQYCDTKGGFECIHLPSIDLTQTWPLLIRQTKKVIFKLCRLLATRPWCPSAIPVRRL